MEKNLREYPEDWEGIAFEVKAAADFQCENCGHLDDREAGYLLTVHHLDANTNNNDPLKLAALCQRCHLRFQNTDLIKQGWLWNPPAWIKKRL